MEKANIILTYLPDLLALPSDEVPYGLMSVHNTLVNEGFNAQILTVNKLMYEDREHRSINNLETNLNWIVDTIIKKEPDIVDFYTMCSNFYVCIEVAERIKKVNKKIKVILAGPHASLVAQNIIENYSFVDLVAMGEGERTVVDIMLFLLGDLKNRNVKGAAYQNVAGDIVVNWEKHDRIAMEDIPFFDQGKYINFKEKEKSITIEGGRGCPFSCYFCSTQFFWGNIFKVKPLNMILNEIEFYYYKYGIEDFSICHDLFTANKKYILDFCNMLILKRLNIKWSCSSRIDTIDEEMITFMAAAGCSNIYFGVETGSVRMQKIINKNLNLNGDYGVVQFLIQNHISCTFSFMYGFPEETEDDINETCATILKIKELEHLYSECSKSVVIQMHKITFLPATSVTNMYLDKLEFDKVNTMNYVDDTTYVPKGIIEKMRKNKEAYINCYDIKRDDIDNRFFSYWGDFLLILINISYYYYRDILLSLIEVAGGLYYLCQDYYNSDNEFFLEISKFAFRYYDTERLEILNSAFLEFTEKLLSCGNEKYKGMSLEIQ